MVRMNDKEQIARDIGYRIRKVRKELRLTQRAFAKKMGVSNTYMCEIENGNRGLGFYSIYNVGRVFKVNPFYLLYGTEPKFHDPSVPVSAAPAPPKVQQPPLTASEKTDDEYGESTPRIRDMLWYIKRSSIVKFGMLSLFTKFLHENRAVVDGEISAAENK
ncbi:MAG: helix-turn-helix transcriptional regulator [bacterium]|nr:helix-turn-helix transcriptional regulator [bacterium]